MWVLRGLLNTQLRHVGLGSRARMGAWHADPIKTKQLFFSAQMGCTLIEVPSR